MSQKCRGDVGRSRNHKSPIRSALSHGILWHWEQLWLVALRNLRILTAERGFGPLQGESNLQGAIPNGPRGHKCPGAVDHYPVLPGVWSSSPGSTAPIQGNGDTFRNAGHSGKIEPRSRAARRHYSIPAWHATHPDHGVLRRLVSASSKPDLDETKPTQLIAAVYGHCSSR